MENRHSLVKDDPATKQIVNLFEVIIFHLVRLVKLLKVDISKKKKISNLKQFI